MGRDMKARLCPKCGREMDLALPPGGVETVKAKVWDGKRSWQCFDCHGPDPLKSKTIQAWLKGELARKREQ